MIRLYGHKMGEGSFTQVTRGFLLAAHERDLLAGFFPIDAMSGDGGDMNPEVAEAPGADAPIAVNLGAPSAVAYAARLGSHKERWLMLAPNSDKLPAEMVKWLPNFITGLLSPSNWGAMVLRQHFSLPVLTCPHGVAPEMAADVELRTKVLEHYRDGFAVLHMTSTNAQRKGTRELLDAWMLCLAQGSLPKSAKLLIVAPDEGLAEQRYWVDQRKLHGTVIVRGQFRMPPKDVARTMQCCHVVCQPSRAEGFGLVPLEARAAGIPVIATDCTGHSEHFPSSPASAKEAGCVLVPSGSLHPLDDFPGSQAPHLDPHAIAEALALAYAEYPTLHINALAQAESVAREWAWTAKTGPVLANLASRP